MAAAPSAQAGLALVLAAALLAASLPGSQARWNLLYFSLSDNSLECDQLQNLRDVATGMAGINASEAPNVFVYIDRADGSCEGQDGSSVLRSPWSNAKDLIINPGGSVTTLRDYPEPAQATSAQLASFIQRGVAAFPRNESGSPARYMLLINDHGGAWSGAGEDLHDATGLINMFDPDWLSVPELYQGISAGLRAAGLQQLDILAFDACLMSNYEVASQLAPVARYLLASHMTEPGTGWDSAGLVRALRPWASPKEVGRQVVGGYVQFGGCAESAGAGGGVCTLALTDLGVLSRRLVPAMTALSSALYNASLAAKQATLDTITAVIAASGSTDDGDLVGSDLQGVLQYLSTLPSNAPPAIAAVVSAARAALPALNASVVHFAKNVRAAPNIHAMSVYLPSNGDEAMPYSVSPTGSGAASALSSWNLTDSPGIAWWLDFIRSIYSQGAVSFEDVAAATWDAPVTLSLTPQENLYTAFTLRSQVPAAVAETATAGRLLFGFVDRFTPDSYIIAGSHDMDGTAFLAAGPDQAPRTVRGLFDGMFVGLRQVLDSAEYEQPYEALSMVHARVFTDNLNAQGRRVSATIQMSVMYADSCTAPGSTYVDGTLYYTVYVDGRPPEIRLFTLGNGGVYGGPGSTSTLQAEVLPSRGGAIITYLKRLTMNNNGTAEMSTTFEYTDCFKWAYPSKLEFFYQHAAMWGYGNYSQFEDLPKSLALLPVILTSTGQSAYFRPITMATPLTAAPTDVAAPRTLNNCSCVVGWGDLDGSTYTDTCAPAYSPAGGDYGTWCPVDPQTCGGRTFDYCSLVPQQPPTDDPAAAANLCMPALVSACRGLIVRSNSTSNGAGGGGGGCYEISMPGHGCPAQLRVTDDCFLQIGLHVARAVDTPCDDAGDVNAVLGEVLHVTSLACETVNTTGGYNSPAKLQMRRVVSARYNTGVTCPGLDDYSTWFGYTEADGIISTGGIANYEHSSACHWIIEAPAGTPHITLEPLSFETEALYDILYVYDGSGLRGAFSGNLSNFATNLTTSTGFLRLLFLTDDTVSYSGFQLRYSLSASLNPRPSCGGGQAALTAVVDVYGYGSDISWALAQGPTLPGAPAPAFPAPPTFRVIAYGGNAPRGGNPAGRAILPYYPPLHSLYANSVETIQYFCVPLNGSSTNYWTLYMFSPSGEGWGGSTLNLYVGANYRMALRQTLNPSIAFNSVRLGIPSLSTLGGNPSAVFTPDTTPANTINFRINFLLPDIANYPPTLVRYYSRLGLTNTLNLMLKWVEASSMGYNATASALTISYSVSGLTSTTQARATVRAYVGNGTLSSFIQAQMAAYRTAYDRPAALRAAAQAPDPGAY